MISHVSYYSKKNGDLFLPKSQSCPRLEPSSKCKGDFRLQMLHEEIFKDLSVLTFQVSVNYHQVLVSAGAQRRRANAQDRC